MKSGLIVAASAVLSTGTSMANAQVALKIGPDNTAAPLTAVQAAMEAPNGQYILDSSEGKVFFFDNAGRFKSAFGRKGLGPGEFTGPRAIGTHDGKIWVTDHALRRVTLFETDGKIASTLSIDQTQAFGRYPLLPEALLKDGSILARTAIPAHLAAGGTETHAPLVRVAADLSKTTVIAKLPLAMSALSIKAGADVGREIQGEQPIQGSPILAVAPNGALFAVIERPVPTGKAGKIVVTFYGNAGTRLGTRQYVVRAIGIPDAYKTRLLNGFIDATTRNGMFRSRPAAERVILKALYLPQYWPSAATAALSSDSSLWIALPSSRAPGRLSEYVVVRPNVSSTTTVTLPYHDALVGVTTSYLYGVVRGGDGLPTVVKYSTGRHKAR